VGADVCADCCCTVMGCWRKKNDVRHCHQHRRLAAS
jgi:hypothetical protein